MKYTKLVHSFLQDSAALYPEKKALFAVGKWHLFGELELSTNKLAHLFISQGMKRGDRVALYLENSMEYVVTYYAILKAGGISVALNTENTADDVGYICRDCGARYLVTSQKLSRNIKSLLLREPLGEAQAGGLFLKRFFVWAYANPIGLEGSVEDIVILPTALEAESSSDPDVRLIDLDTASIVYTSGSTGKPRGAVLSHLNIISNTRSIVDYLELTAEDRIMVVLPFYYIYGKSLLNTHFFVGGSVVIDNRFMYPNVILQTMREQGVTGLAGVPSTFTILLRRSNLKSQEFKRLRYLTQAGGPMAPAVQKEIAEAFAPAKLYIMYGATEASARLSYLDPRDLPRKWGSIGKAIPNVDLFVADGQGKPLGVGEEGEIVARGSNIMSCYWNHPEETEKVLRNALYYTGDLGKTDDEGFIFVVGRSRDMIKIGGNRVSAKEIEDALYEHRAVIEAAVVGMPDDVLGEAPKAYLVMSKSYEGKIEKELPLFLQKYLAAYKIPKYFEIRDSLPKNESGKIQKLKLK
jgi:long-chain acyl-CoA synthetase